MEPVDFNNLTDDQRRIGAHPFIGWLIAGLFVAAFAFSLFR